MNSKQIADFIERTAKDYDMEISEVKECMAMYPNWDDFYNKLESLSKAETAVHMHRAKEGCR